MPEKLKCPERDSNPRHPNLMEEFDLSDDEHCSKYAVYI